jgi:hypothetical protein
MIAWGDGTDHERVTSTVTDTDDYAPMYCVCGHRAFEHWYPEDEETGDGHPPCHAPRCPCAAWLQSAAPSSAESPVAPVRPPRRRRVPDSHVCAVPDVDRSPLPPDRGSWECGVCGRKFRYAVNIPRPSSEIAAQRGYDVPVVTRGWVEIKGPVR